MAHLLHSHSVSLPPSPTSLKPPPNQITEKLKTTPDTEGERLLLPAVHRPPKPAPTPRSAKSDKSRHSRTPILDAGQAPTDYGEDVLAEELRMFVVEDEDLELEGYQLYAVERWVVERDKLLPTVTVWTGDSADKIYVTVLRLWDTSIPFTTAVHPLRKNGARPKETPHGTIMVTSLANFRPDLTIVHLPGGSFPEIKEDLAVNIDLLRLGCSGRRALTLESPNQATQDKFLQIYHLVPSNPFSLTVLTLVKMVQSALLIFGCFPAPASLRDGLLCDLTVNGLQKWMVEVGEPVFDLEPGGRVLEPEVVAALLSSITAARHRLAAQPTGRLRAPSESAGRNLFFSSDIPKDPLAEPIAFLQSLSKWQRSQKLQVSFLNVQILSQLKYEHGSRQRRLSDPHKVISRALLQKLDEFPIHGHQNSSHDLETKDLETFVRLSIVKGGDGLDTVRWLWTGKARRELARQGLAWDSQSRVKGEDGVEDDGDSLSAALFRGTGKVTKKSQALMEGITGWKSGLLDFGRHKKHGQDDGDALRTASTQASTDIPTFIISPGLSDDELDGPAYRSAQTQPTPSPGRSAQSSYTNLSDTLFPASAPAANSKFSYAPIRRLQSPVAKPVRPSILTSRSDTVLYDKQVDFGDSDSPGPILGHPGLRPLSSNHSIDEERRLKHGWRRRSFSNLQDYKELRRVIVGRLKTDVDLSQALMDLRDREHVLRDTVATLESLVIAQREANTSILGELQQRRTRLESVRDRARLVLTDPSMRRTSREGVQPIITKVQHGDDNLGRLKYTFEVADDRLREVELLVRGLTRRIEESAVPEDESKMIKEGENKEWMKGGQRLRSRLVGWGMWTYQLWEWIRGKGSWLSPGAASSIRDAASGRTKGSPSVRTQTI